MSDSHAKLQYVYNDCIYCGDSVLVPLHCRLVVYICDRCKVRLQEYSSRSSRLVDTCEVRLEEVEDE